jgi:hypothetical protein
MPYEGKAKEIIYEKIQVKQSTTISVVIAGEYIARQQCPAYGKQCRVCGKLNHFQKVCEKTLTRPRQRRPVNEVTEIQDGYFTCNPQEQHFTRNQQHITNEEQTFVIDSVGSSEAAEIK